MEQEKREKSIQRQWSVWRQIENENERSSSKESERLRDVFGVGKERKKYSETDWYEDGWKKIGKKIFKKKKKSYKQKFWKEKFSEKLSNEFLRKISRNKFETIVKKKKII